VLDGNLSPPKRRTAAPPPLFDPCLLWPKTAGCFKMPLCTEVLGTESSEVGVGPGHIVATVVLGGDPALPAERGTAARRFSAHVYCGHMVAHLSNC